MDAHDASSVYLRIHLLGQFRVDVGGRPLSESAIPGRKARALLKLLALQRQCRLVRDRAMDILWPDLDSSSAAAQLYKAIHHIRKAFSTVEETGHGWIEITEDLVRLVPPGGVTTDVLAFEEAARRGLRNGVDSELEAAVSMYAGDLLPMDTYARWAAVPRDRYRQLYVDVLIMLGESYEGRGDLSEAAEMFRLALEKDRALESAHRGLMRVFARQGQTARALRQFERCRDALQEELGAEPSADTSEVVAYVREGRQHAEQAMLHVTAPMPMPAIVGRVEECAQIGRALERLSAGHGGVLVITGDVGTGKTRLVQELALGARRSGARVFSGSASEIGGEVTYAPFVEILEAALREHRELEAELPLEIGQLVPSFSAVTPPVPHADRLAAQGYIYAQIQRFFARLADIRPLVLVVEDLHAAEEGTRGLFSYLTRYCTARPILLVATLREKEAPPAFRRSVGKMEREGVAAVLSLRPLSPEQHLQLLQQHSQSADVSPEAAERIFGVSEGNPLFALELLRYRFGDGDDAVEARSVEAAPAGLAGTAEIIPPSLRFVVDQRLHGLSPAAHHLLYLCAVIGRQVPYDVISASWTGRSADGASGERVLFDLLEEVTRAGLLQERGLDYSFHHALVHRAIYESIAEARRRALHALVARRLLSIRSGEGSDVPVEKIARHFVGAGDFPKAVEYLMLAGERAEAAYAHEDALQRFREALALLDGGEDVQLKWAIHERMGDVYRACGRLEKSYDAYEEAVRWAEKAASSTPGIVELHRKIALVAIFKTDMDRSERHLASAFELVDSDARSRSRLLIVQALQLWHFNRLEEAARIAHEALDLAEATGAGDIASQACEMLAMAYLPLGRWEEGLKYEMRRQVYGWSPDIVVATDAHLCLWEYHVGGDQPFEQARTFISTVSELASERGDLRCVAVCHYALGTMHLWRGERTEAAAELEKSMDLHNRVGSPAGMAYALARKAVLFTMAGRLDAGWEAVRRGIRYSQRAAVRDHCLQRLYGVGLWNRMSAGDLASAEKLVRQSEAVLSDAGACAACALDLYPWLSYFYLDQGDIDRVRECGAAVSELASQTGNPIASVITLMIESTLDMIDQNENQAERKRHEAFELAESAVTGAVHSPVKSFLESMEAQQVSVRPALQ